MSEKISVVFSLDEILRSRFSISPSSNTSFSSALIFRFPILALGIEIEILLLSSKDLENITFFVIKSAESKSF